MHDTALYDAGHPRPVAAALRRARFVETEVARQWLINVGARTALERTAHLLCELFTRLQAVGLTLQNTCTLPLTQVEIAEALALSSVHLNRTLMKLRRQHLMTFRGQRLTIHDHAALRLAAGFSADYLHIPYAAAERSGPSGATNGQAGVAPLAQEPDPLSSKPL